MRYLSTIRELAAEVRTNKSMRRETYSMSLYVSIILLSALSVFDDSHPPERGEVLLLELGTTVGLVLAHGFASWVSTRIIGEANEEIDPGDLLLVQLSGSRRPVRPARPGGRGRHRRHQSLSDCLTPR